MIKKRVLKVIMKTIEIKKGNINMIPLNFMQW